MFISANAKSNKWTIRLNILLFLVFLKNKIKIKVFTFTIRVYLINKVYGIMLDGYLNLALGKTFQKSQALMASFPKKPFT